MDFFFKAGVEMLNSKWMFGKNQEPNGIVNYFDNYEYISINMMSRIINPGLFIKIRSQK